MGIKVLYFILVAFGCLIFGCKSPDIRSYQNQLGEADSAGKWSDLERPEPMRFNSGDDYFWILQTSKGVIRIKLWPEKAPRHVSSTIYLTNIDFYNGRKFYRVVPGFLAQGGCNNDNGTGKIGYKEQIERTVGMEHDRPYLVGAVNNGDNSDGSQFYITFGKAKQLNGLHTIFGEVVEGQEVVDVIESMGSRKGLQKDGVIITSAAIDTRIDSDLPEGELIVSNLKASNNKHGSIALKWDVDSASMATDYRVIRCKKGTSKKYACEWQPHTSYDDLNAEMGQTYEYWVQAKNGVSIGELSKPVMGYRKAKKTKGKLRVPYEVY